MSKGSSHILGSLSTLEPLGPQQCREQVSEQEHDHQYGQPDHDGSPHTLSQAFTKAAKLIAGRISIIAAEMQAQEKAESQASEQAKKE